MRDFIKQLLNEVTEKYANQVDTVYRSPEVVVLAPKNSKIAAKYSHGTDWCSKTSTGFCLHRTHEVLFRVLFKDGYKLRLNVRNSGGAGTWGGPNEKETKYPLLPFKRTPKSLDAAGVRYYPNMAQHIQSIPDEAIEKILEYTKKNAFTSSEVAKKTATEIKNLQKECHNLSIEMFNKYDEDKQVVGYSVKFYFKIELLDEIFVDDAGLIYNFRQGQKSNPIPFEKVKLWVMQQDKKHHKDPMEEVEEWCYFFGYSYHVADDKIYLMDGMMTFAVLTLKDGLLSHNGHPANVQNIVYDYKRERRNSQQQS